ncbi:MAG: inorganic phosphate transporter, partial [Chlamydiales bacterium]|nr:inorganic phosphate transporter [Chlamydiales bacterium]
VSNAMGTSVGSGALTLRRAVILAAILEFCGAFFAGSNVSETVQKGLIDTDMFLTEPTVLILGMCAALFGTSLWLQIASYFGWPVSTTHAIVGAVIGFGGVVGGSEAIQWAEVGSIAASWIISPVTAGVVSYIIFSVLQRYILFAMNPTEATRKLLPVLVCIVFATFTFSLLLNGIQNVELSLAQILGIALLIGLTAFAIAYLLVQRFFPAEFQAKSVPFHLPHNVISLDKAIKHLQRVHLASQDETQEKVGALLKEVKILSLEVRQKTNFSEKASEYRNVEKMFMCLQILSACFVAFAHGANDVANAIGPVAAVLDIIQNGQISAIASVPPWLLAFGGVGIVVGLATWGWRVIETIGKKITEL